MKGDDKVRPSEKKQYDRQNRFNRENYDRVGTMLPKGTKDRIRQKAEAMGLTMNAYIKKVIMDSLDEE